MAETLIDLAYELAITMLLPRLTQNLFPGTILMDDGRIVDSKWNGGAVNQGYGTRNEINQKASLPGNIRDPSFAEKHFLRVT